MSEVTAEKPKGKTQASPDSKPDNRTISERICAVKAKLATGCLEKRGCKNISSVDIWYVLQDDVLELLRQLLAAEGLDIWPSMSPDHPPKEILTKTRNGTRCELQIWFKINIEIPGEKQVDWWWAQDSDAGICSSYAFKQYLLKRFQLSGGFMEGPGSGLDGSENVPTEHLPQHQQNFAPLNVTPQQAQKMDVSGPPAQSGPKPIPGNGPQAPQEQPQASQDPMSELSGADMSPEESAMPGNREEIRVVWQALNESYKAEGEAKAQLLTLLPHMAGKNIWQMTRGDIHQVWSHLNGGEIPF